MPTQMAAYLASRLCALAGEGQASVLRTLDTDQVLFTASGAILVGGIAGQWPASSPEGLRARPLDARTDVFLIAAVLHGALTGERLFGRPSKLATIEAALTAELPERPPFIPVPLHDVLRRALDARPAARYPTPRALAEALAPFHPGVEAEEFVRWLSSQVALAPVELEPPPPTPLGSNDEGARLVYADWLEEQGRCDEANWVRVESRLRGLEGPALDAALEELRPLSLKVGTDFMATVARPPIERCPVRFGFECPLRWEALQRTERTDVRHCAGCRMDVHFCRSVEEAMHWSVQGGCVALDPALERSPGDVNPDFESPRMGKGTYRQA